MGDMEFTQLDEMTGGWFVGHFTPAALTSSAMEVGVKRYPAGATEPRHVHLVATEITVVLEGIARFDGRDAHAGTIVRINPGEPVTFEAVTDVLTVVVKAPSVPGDKYLSE